ncbi:hypothetical protein [Thiomicrorhabdus cannonii]|uniref:hypothetical protein n=1 Tax=Thiomicrorhabdus cannonii TaxID=2748011 RepID=UPI0015BCD39F|nr:hypothetical protein [Thiomicrorhabdus cannonii]
MVKYQKGLVLLETAYVLPLVVLAGLFVLEVVSYSLNSLAANDVLTDVHTQIIADVADVSSSPDGIASGYAVCTGNKVVLDTSKSGELTTHVKGALEAKGVTFVSGQPLVASISARPISGFDVYVINFKGTANSLVLPDMLEKFLPINVDTIVSIKDTCTSS